MPDTAKAIFGETKFLEVTNFNLLFSSQAQRSTMKSIQFTELTSNEQEALQGGVTLPVVGGSTLPSLLDKLVPQVESVVPSLPLPA